MDSRNRSPEADLEHADRPFSLTPDPGFHYFSRSHRRAFDLLSAGIRRGDRVLLLAGDLGVGKTTLCRVLTDSSPARCRTAHVSDALLSADGLLRLVLQDLGVVPPLRAGAVGLADASFLDMVRMLDQALHADGPGAPPALVVIDEAQRLPASTARQLAVVAARGPAGSPRLQLVLAAQSSADGGAALPDALDQQVTARARLAPLDRDECGPYITHRLARARAGTAVTFSARAVETLHALSGGVPRLVNLIAERALRDAGRQEGTRIERPMVEAAAAAQAMTHVHSRRFRWFPRRAS